MKKILLFFLLFSLYSCQPNTETILEGEPTKLVIWGRLHPDSIVTVYIGQSTPPLSILDKRNVLGAKVFLYENSIIVDSLKENQQGLYASLKNFKPREGNIYFLKVYKEGFDAIETLPDTMPNKPKLISYLVKDSIHTTKEYSYTVNFSLYTNKPSHFVNYGYGKVFLIQNGVKTEKTIYYNRLNSCNLDGFGFQDYYFLPKNCELNNIYDLYLSNDEFGKQLINSKIKMTLCSITNQAIDINRKLYELDYQYTDYYSPVNVFWNPIYLPNMVKNGYGYVGCYNTTDIEIEF